MKMRLWAVVLAAVMSGSILTLAQARPPETQPPKDDRPFLIHTLGMRSCGLWLEAYANRENESDVRLLQFNAYLEGFASAYNILGPDKRGARKNILSDVDTHALHTFIENYCRANPLEEYWKAISALFRELLSKKAP